MAALTVQVLAPMPMPLRRIFLSTQESSRESRCMPPHDEEPHDACTSYLPSLISIIVTSVVPEGKGGEGVVSDSRREGEGNSNRAERSQEELSIRDNESIKGQGTALTSTHVEYEDSLRAHYE
jgi:hypothetical protein